MNKEKKFINDFFNEEDIIDVQKDLSGDSKSIIWFKTIFEKENEQDLSKKIINEVNKKEALQKKEKKDINTNQINKTEKDLLKINQEMMASNNFENEPIKIKPEETLELINKEELENYNIKDKDEILLEKIEKEDQNNNTVFLKNFSNSNFYNFDDNQEVKVLSDYPLNKNIELNKKGYKAKLFKGDIKFDEDTISLNNQHIYIENKLNSFGVYPEKIISNSFYNYDRFKLFFKNKENFKENLLKIDGGWRKFIDSLTGVINFNIIDEKSLFIDFSKKRQNKVTVRNFIYSKYFQPKDAMVFPIGINENFEIISLDFKKENTLLLSSENQNIMYKFFNSLSLINHFKEDEQKTRFIYLNFKEELEFEKITNTLYKINDKSEIIKFFKELESEINIRKTSEKKVLDETTTIEIQREESELIINVVIDNFQNFLNMYSYDQMSYITEVMNSAHKTKINFILFSKNDLPLPIKNMNNIKFKNKELKFLLNNEDAFFNDQRSYIVNSMNSEIKEILKTIEKENNKN